MTIQSLELNSLYLVLGLIIMMWNILFWEAVEKFQSMRTVIKW